MMVVGATAALLASSTVRSAISALWSTSEYLAAMRHHSLHKEMEQLDLKATLEMIQQALEVYPHHKDTQFSVHMVQQTCSEIQNVLDIVHKKIEAHQSTWITKRLWNCDCTNEMKRLKMLKERLLQRFELLANITRIKS